MRKKKKESRKGVGMGHVGTLWGDGQVLYLVWEWSLQACVHVLKLLILLKYVFFTVFSILPSCGFM